MAVLVVEQLQVMMQVAECFMAGHKAARAAVVMVVVVVIIKSPTTTTTITTAPCNDCA